MRIIFKDTRFMMRDGCYCDQTELKSMTDEEIAKVAEATAEHIKTSLNVALLKQRDELNKEENK